MTSPEDFELAPEPLHPPTEPFPMRRPEGIGSMMMLPLKSERDKWDAGDSRRKLRWLLNQLIARLGPNELVVTARLKVRVVPFHEAQLLKYDTETLGDVLKILDYQESVEG